MRLSKEDVKNNRLVRHAYYFGDGIVRRGKLKRKAGKMQKAFGIEYLSVKEKEIQIKDMIDMYMRYGYGFDEYLYFHFANKSLKERLSFVADWEHLGYTCAMNNPQNAELFDNKWKTYQLFKEYYGREVVLCEGVAGEAKFLNMAKKHTRFIVKPVDESCGHGVKLIHNLGEDILSELYYDLLNKNHGRLIAEELIHQVDNMAAFHPASVNTIRATTIRLDNEVLIIHPFLKIGQHGNHVDNGGAGGILCTIDLHTGKITEASDEKSTPYTIHPDTKKKIVGFTVPKWEKLISLVQELALRVPDNRYTGWDLALTESGWVMVEANRRGQFVGWQIPTQIGFREELNDIMRRAGLKY